MRYLVGLGAFASLWLAICANADAGRVKVGDLIVPENSSAVADLVSPGNYQLVQQGMRMKIVATRPLEWPPPYKAATEKYSSQVQLGSNGDLQNYLAGLPFPFINENSPTAALQVMWNFSYRPQYTDDADLRYVEVARYAPGETPQSAVEHFTIGHFGFYNNIGRTEVPPVPTDPEASAAGIRYRFGAFPFLEPPEIRGFGLIRYRSKEIGREDDAWYFNPNNRHLSRFTAETRGDPIGPVSMGEATANRRGIADANNLAPDSYFGFSAKIEDFNFRLLCVKPMLASVHAESSPARPCPFDGNRSICPEAWEMRRLYVIEAIAKPRLWCQMVSGGGVSIPRRVLFVDSEGWFITASDLYDGSGRLWKTIATFNTYRDRPVPDAKVAVFPYQRIFQTALVDEDLLSGFSTVAFMPGRDSEEHECWYINMGFVTKAMIEPEQMTRIGP